MSVPVLVVTTDSEICGTERMVLALLQNLDKHRFQPTLVTLKGPGDLVREAESMNIQGLNLNLDQNLVQGLRLWFQQIRQTHPRIVHSFLFHSNLLARITKLRYPNISVISGLRTVYTIEDYGRLYGLLERATHFLDSFYVANSSLGIASVRENMKLPEKKLRVIRNGIDPNPFPHGSEWFRKHYRKQLGYQEEDVVIGVVAQLRTAKRHDLLIRVVADLRGQFPFLRLLIVGGGKRQAELQELAGRYQVDEITSFTGFRSDARQMLRAMDIFALPSEVEGQPVSIMEAMEAELPVVAMRTGGIPEVVQEPETALLAEPGNEEQFRQHLQRLLEHPRLRHQLGQKGRERIEREFSVHVMTREYEALYEHLLDSQDRTKSPS
ncbi:MAG: glycosyltransferase [bacterium]